MNGNLHKFTRKVRYLSLKAWVTIPHTRNVKIILREGGNAKKSCDYLQLTSRTFRQ